MIETNIQQCSSVPLSNALRLNPPKKSFAGLNEDLVGDVNTIQELTFILGADSAGLGDLGAHE